MSFIKRNIPNTITCGNLVCGCLALVNAFEGNLVWAAYLVGIALVLDFFDGFTARLLKVSSPIGRDLDSLADMVTFGVVPGVVMFRLIKTAIVLNTAATFGLNFGHWYSAYLPYIGFIIPVFSAIRLAKFNNDPRQSDSFIGVPTPANAILICSIGLYIYSNPFFIHGPATIDWTIDPPLPVTVPIASPIFSVFSSLCFLIPLAIIFSFLLISELPLIALKFKHFKWKDNEVRFILIIGVVVLLAALKLVGIPLAIVFYILLSIINNILTKRKAQLPN